MSAAVLGAHASKACSTSLSRPTRAVIRWSSAGRSSRTAFFHYAQQAPRPRTTRAAGARSIVMQAAAAQPSSHQLLIVGPGVLGSNLGKRWLDAFGPGQVVGQTNSTANHDRLRALGIDPYTKDQAGTAKFPYVLFSAPPSGSADYLGEIKAALDRWDGTGCFVFTSSAAVYPVEDGSPCDEDTPTVQLGSSERTDKLLKAEQLVLGAGGCVVRLVGLYHAKRGAHTFFLREKEVPRWGGYTVNLIHYEDAAALCLAVLRGAGAEDGQQYKGRTFLGCDGAPITFEDMMAATLQSGAFSGGSYSFVGAEGPVKGKRMSNPRTRQQLGWEPKYPSFQEFMTGHKAQDWYTAAEEKVPAGMPHA